MYVKPEFSRNGFLTGVGYNIDFLGANGTL